MRRRRLSLRAGALAALTLSAAVAASAWIPSVSQIANAFAQETRSAGRGRPLVLDVAVFVGGEVEPAATGKLLSDAKGRARLQLRHRSGFVERQLRNAGGLTASRDGEVLGDPRPLLPPLWLLQARSGGRVLARFGELGGDTAQVALAHDGEHDCWVLGAARPGAPRLWIDQDTRSVVRLDLDEVRYRFGEIQEVDDLQLPAWISVESDGAAVVVLEVVGGAPAKLVADDFQPDWLTR